MPKGRFHLESLILLKKKFFFSLTILFFFNTALCQESSSPAYYNDPVRTQWGIAAGTGWITDYAGAAQGRMRYLVMPAYRSKFLTIDRQDGAKAHLLTDNRLKFSFSFAFLLPTSSKDIPVRQGMPNLDLILQLGPELQIYLLRTDFFRMYLRLPLRFIVATDFRHDFDYLQWTFAPSLRTEYNLGNEYGKIGTRMEFDYASQAYSSYFYAVDTKYATANRPAYSAEMGIMQYILGLQYSYDALQPLTLSFSANIYLLNNTKNAESPLHVRDEGYSLLSLAVYYF